MEFAHGGSWEDRVGAGLQRLQHASAEHSVWEGQVGAVLREVEHAHCGGVRVAEVADHALRVERVRRWNGGADIDVRDLAEELVEVGDVDHRVDRAVGRRHA